MKKFAAISAALVPVIGFAQEKTFAGTKKDIIAAPLSGGATTMGVMQLVQMLFAIGIVFVLIKYLLPKIATRVGKKLNTKLGAGIKVEETASFGGGMLYIVEARGHTLLLSVGAQGVSCLADLTEKPKQEEPFVSFKELVDEQPVQEEAEFKAVVQVIEDADEQPKDQALEAIEALRRFAN